MAMYRKLSKASKPRRALLRNQVTQLLYNGKIVTTEARAKEVRQIAEHLIALGVREKDNTETVTVKVKHCKKENGKRVVLKKVMNKDHKFVKVYDYDITEKEVTKDMPSRLAARRQMYKTLYKVTEVPAETKGRRKNTKVVDITDKIFDEYAPKYADRKGGYTRMIKIGQRKGDAAMMVVLELV
ncbi:50S ribosomal protein L17 [Butyrivibrio sp. MC2013]|uniref:50S ribosomal protein L17 n=1 Tax=Butyrivibrio sp. MC2013 TaxID=1280686 RepID=UPI00047BE19F|nr:50S ribosomal protein L17 [Butyrivibrio sp. MC2013]